MILSTSEGDRCDKLMLALEQLMILALEADVVMSVLCS